MNNCLFCSEEFPYPFQIIQSHFQYRILIHDINPMCDFHCLLVLKEHHHWIDDNSIDKKAIDELWEALHVSTKVIRDSSKEIKTVQILSLNSWEESKHLHFHLIPIQEYPTKINDRSISWSWITSLAMNEITIDCLNDYLIKRCWIKWADQIKEDINNHTIQRVKDNIEILNNFMSNHGRI